MQYFFTKTWWLIPVLLLSVSIGWSGADKSGASTNKTPQRAQSESEYRRLQTELKLAESAVPYLTLDLPRSEIQIRLGGVIVWNQPLRIVSGDSDKLDDFITRFRHSSRNDVRYLWDKRLYAAQERFSDSVITLVTKVLEVNPELLQRQLPSRFQLEWGDNLILEFRTELKVDTKPSFGERLRNFWTAIGRPKQTILVANMPVEEAMTLFRATHPGTPTLIISNRDL